MNPKLTITVDAKNRALSVASGMITVGAKIDVEISGLPGDIPPWGASDAFSGPSVRFRLVDECGRDLARYPLAEGDRWEQSGGVLSSLTPVEFDTDRLRRAFRGVAFDDTLPFGVIVDSAVDAAQYAVGRVKVRQWAAASTEDPTVLPDWRETLDRLQKDLAEISAKRDDAVAAKAAAVSAASEAQSSRNEAAASANASSAASDRAHASASDANDANAAAQKANAAAQNAKTDAEAARDRAEAASGDFDGRLKDYAKKEEVKSDLASKADLVGGKVPSSQLPSYVDDVLEFETKAAFPTAEQAEAGKIYIDKETGKTYRWGGTGYVEISKSLALGETATTAYAGDKGRALSDKIDAHVKKTDNPHAVTAAQVGAYTTVQADDRYAPKSGPLATAKSRLSADGKLVRLESEAAATWRTPRGDSMSENFDLREDTDTSLYEEFETADGSSYLAHTVRKNEDGTFKESTHAWLYGVGDIEYCTDHSRFDTDATTATAVTTLASDGSVASVAFTPLAAYASTHPPVTLVRGGWVEVADLADTVRSTEPLGGGTTFGWKILTGGAQRLALSVADGSTAREMEVGASDGSQFVRLSARSNAAALIVSSTNRESGTIYASGDITAGRSLCAPDVLFDYRWNSGTGAYLYKSLNDFYVDYTSFKNGIVKTVEGAVPVSDVQVSDDGKTYGTCVTGKVAKVDLSRYAKKADVFGLNLVRGARMLSPVAGMSGITVPMLMTMWGITPVETALDGTVTGLSSLDPDHNAPIGAFRVKANNSVSGAESLLIPDGSDFLTKTKGDSFYAAKEELNALASKVDAANAALEEVA